MTTTALVTHCGARLVERAEVEMVGAPPATATWFPVKHATVIETVSQSLTASGFEVKASKFELSRGEGRLFATIDLATPLGSGVSLAVGVRNSTDRSLPLGFIAGSRV